MPEYNWENKIDKIIENKTNFFENNKLHLNVSMRSFRSEKVSALVEHIINLNIESSQNLLKEIDDKYPILLTRNLDNAKIWTKNKKRGSERCGLLASSDAKRLSPVGISVKDQADIASYFLDDEEKDFKNDNTRKKIINSFKSFGENSLDYIITNPVVLGEN